MSHEKVNSIRGLSPLYSIVVDNLDSPGMRLDAFLAREFPDVSRSQWQKVIDRGMVTVDGLSPKAKTLILDGMQVMVYESPNPKGTHDGIIQPLVPSGDILEELYRDEDVLVINKPAGMTVHPGHGTDGHTLVHALLTLDPSISSTGGDTHRPGIVHRLDKGTSGVMIVARNPKAYHILRQAFDTHQVQKTYAALCYGRMTEPVSTIRTAINRSHSNPRVFTTVGHGGRSAETHIEREREIGPFTLVKARPITGRTHQIRVHLMSVNLPIFGDPLYGPVNLAKGKRDLARGALGKQWQPLAAALGRPFLHAAEITLALPSGEMKTFRAPLPPDLVSCIHEIERLLRTA